MYQVDPTGGDKTLAFIYPQEVLYATHTVQYKGDVHEARMYVVVQDRSGRCYSVDPFDFRWNAGVYRVLMFGLVVDGFSADQILL